MDYLRPILVLLGACWVTLMVTITMERGLRQGWRLAFLAALTVMGLLCWLITEILGAFRAITLPGIAVAWTVAALAATLQAFGLFGRRKQYLRPALEDLKQGAASLPLEAVLQLAFMFISGGVLAVIAYAAAPNTWDSLTYHLSRIMHWQQERSLAFYATPIQRQLAFGPMAEMGMLNYQILAGSDRLAAFMQFFGMVGCVAGASLIAKKLGAELRGQLLAALAVMTIPMGVLQATSTQNDYVVALWSICFVLFVIVQVQEGASAALALLAGAALGLAVDTKITALLYLASVGLWYAAGLIRQLRAAAWKPLAEAALVGVVVLLPQAARNFGLYGNLLGTAPGPELSGYVNEVISPRVWASNLVRNVAAQLATPSARANQLIEQGVQQVHAIIGLGVNSPVATWRGSHFQVVFTLHEDSASDPVQLILVAAALAAVLIGKRSKTAPYALCVLGGVGLLCIVLKWQPWNSRLELPLLILGMPLVGAAASAHLPRPALGVGALVLAMVSLPYLLGNSTRPLVGARSVLLTDRLNQYFYFPSVVDTSASYTAVARILSAADCDRVGLVLSFDDREYLSWVTLRTYEPGAEFEHIMVKNPSGQYGAPFVPCAIVSTTTPGRPQIIYEGRQYVRTGGTDPLALFLESTAPP